METNTQTEDGSQVRCEELLACPFCGKQPIVFPSDDGTGEMVECETSGCVNPHVSYYGKNVARHKWNTRRGNYEKALLKMALELAYELRSRCNDSIHDDQIKDLRALETELDAQANI